MFFKKLRIYIKDAMENWKKIAIVKKQNHYLEDQMEDYLVTLSENTKK